MSDAANLRCFCLTGVILSLGAVIILAGGCHDAVHPFVDPFAGSERITTASRTGAFEQEKQPTAVVRPFAEGRIAAADGAVTHGPLYFEDWLGDMARDDGEFAWTGEDFLSVLTWRARFLLNIGLFPISAFDTPPWCEMTSDGRASRRVLWKNHDAG